MSSGSPEPDFARLFRGERFRFEFGIRPADSPWFRLASPGQETLTERRNLLEQHPERHAPWSSPADPLLDELLDLFTESKARQWKGRGATGARELAGNWEPDFVLLRRLDGEFRLVGACVCDPSWWDPVAQLGKSVEAIHEPVPTLNPNLGPRIHTFLDRLPPGQTFIRENWGLAAVPDRNLHPALNRPRLNLQSAPENVWLRVEHQAFHALPHTGGLAFVIWLTVHRLSAVLTAASTAAAFSRQLATMPDEIARYKGLAAVRPTLLTWLGSVGPT